MMHGPINIRFLVFNGKPSHNDVRRNRKIATRILNPDKLAGYFSASRSGSFKPCETTQNRRLLSPYSYLSLVMKRSSSIDVNPSPAVHVTFIYYSEVTL